MSTTREMTSTSPASSGELEALVADLPEVYQPIYGHPNWGSLRSGNGARLLAVLETAGLLTRALGRSLRIVDLGSAQGYVAFRLAESGHHVTGVELLPSNVALAVALGEENPRLDVRFVHGDLVEVETLVELADYDLVIGLSVLHHIAHRDGHHTAVSFVAKLSRHVSHAVFEMALAEEPMPWAVALPADPCTTLAPFAFMREIARVETHLSEIRRPVLFCSQSHALVRGNLEPIQSWTSRSHQTVDDTRTRSMRYYFLPDAIAKTAAWFNDSPEAEAVRQLREELRREAHMLQRLPSIGIRAPSLLEFVDGFHTTSVARTAHPGVALDEIVGVLDDDERTAITTQVLDALTQLEANGLYHTDLRLWNVIFDRADRRAHLIDHGAIRADAGDCMWPNDAYYSFLLFVVALWGRFSDQSGAASPRISRIDSAELPARVAALLALLLTHPKDAVVFGDLCARWTQTVPVSSTAQWPTTPLAWSWLSAVEENRNALLEAHIAARVSWDASTAEQTARYAQLAEEHEGLRTQVSALQTERDSLLTERVSLVTERNALEEAVRAMGRVRADLQANRDALAAELSLTRQTLSWRITKPLRFVRRHARLGGR